MTQVRVSLLCAVLLGSGAAAAEAQTPQEGWQVSVDFLMLTTRGNDVHVGDVFTEATRLSGTFTDFRFDYGVTYQEIVPRMKSDQSVLVAAAYRGPRWGFGARGWRVATDGAVEGSGASAAPTATTETLTGIRMWDQSLIPVTNQQDPSGISPVTYHAENSLKNIRIEGYAERRLLAGSDLNLGARFGLAHARMENLRVEGQTQRAFVVETVGGTTTTLMNDIAIRSESEASTSLTGPLVGLAGDSTFGRVRLDWAMNQAVLLGTAETLGRWTDVDDITEISVTGGVSSTTFTLLNGEIPIASRPGEPREERVVVPTLDLQVKASVRATRMVSVGVGYFSSAWFRLPVAPAFSVPGEWTDLSGTGWRDQTRDVMFNAFSVFASFGF